LIGSYGLKKCFGAISSAFISNHFSQLFISSSNQNPQRLLDCVESKVTHDMNSALLQEFWREEVYAALKSIGNLKAPGPDGMPALFYKEYWDIVGDDVVTEVLKVLREGLCRQGGMTRR
jgi:hypothetical protein